MPKYLKEEIHFKLPFCIDNMGKLLIAWPIKPLKNLSTIKIMSQAIPLLIHISSQNNCNLTIDSKLELNFLTYTIAPQKNDNIKHLFSCPSLRIQNIHKFI